MNKYDSYKDSGVEWIGEIPSHWKFIKTNILTKNLDGKRIPLNSEQRGEMNGKIPYWGSNGVVDYINEYIFDEEIVLVGEDGSPFFDKLKPVSFFVNERVWVNNHIHILKPKELIISKYLTHSFNCVDYKEFITGSTRDKLTQSDLSRIPHTTPPLHEQHQIVQFLDTKTSLIDTLIEKTQRKIEILKEKRTSLINHVVTKGLNPNVEMKDSGVELIGEIPKHWITTRIKYFLYEIIDTEHKTVSFFEDGDYSVVRTTNIKKGKLITNGIRKTNYDGFTEWTRRGIPNPGDVLLTREGPVGECCIVPSDFDFCLGQRVVWLKVKNKELNSKFLVYTIYSENSINFMNTISLGSTVTHLNMSEIGNIPIFYCSIDQQQQIVEYLDEQTQIIDTTVTKEQKRIKLLKEYRQSLISEVVTGKIKVTTDE